MPESRILNLTPDINIEGTALIVITVTCHGLIIITTLLILLLQSQTRQLIFKCVFHSCHHLEEVVGRILVATFFCFLCSSFPPSVSSKLTADVWEIKLKRDRIVECTEETLYSTNWELLRTVSNCTPPLYSHATVTRSPHSISPFFFPSVIRVVAIWRHRGSRLVLY